MTASRNGKLKYLLIGAVLIIALFGILFLIVPEKVDEHAGQVYINDGFEDVWMTPYENVPASVLTRDDFRTVDGIPTYTGNAFATELGVDVSEHQWGIDWQAAAQKIEEAGIFAKAAVAEKAIPRCNLCFVTGEQMKAELAAFLEIMFGVAPQSVGGAVPGDDFYCVLQ